MASGSSHSLQNSALSVSKSLHFLQCPWEVRYSDLTFTSLLKISSKFFIHSGHHYAFAPNLFHSSIISFCSSPISIQLHQLSLFTLSDTFHIHLPQASLPLWNERICPITSDKLSFQLLTPWHHHSPRSNSPPAPVLTLLKQAGERAQILLASCASPWFSSFSSLPFLFWNSPDWSFCCQPSLPPQLSPHTRSAVQTLTFHLKNQQSSQHISWSLNSLVNPELPFRALPMPIWKKPLKFIICSHSLNFFVFNVLLISSHQNRCS